MADPVVVAVANVGIALTRVLLRACDSTVSADLVGDGQELVGVLSRSLRRTDESKDQIEHRISWENPACCFSCQTVRKRKLEPRRMDQRGITRINPERPGRTRQATQD